ncbi:MAG TPA: hypothetical protein VGW75_13055 [Solirubrobacteraceae bacterium]|nr:hypothetical protein [Solirubrobacteraceae bacterium]
MFATTDLAAGHSIDYYASGTYPGRPHQERVFFDRNATGAIRDRFIAAQNQWDNITSRFQFVIYRDELDTDAPRRCAADQPRKFDERASLIGYQYLDGRGGHIADTGTCSRASDGRLEYFNTIVDTADDIYFGRGDAPDETADMGSIAVHELGHAAGWVYHYDDPEARDAANESMCRDHDGQPTMCAHLYPGTERWRNLDDHDQHTHADAYNR